MFAEVISRLTAAWRGGGGGCFGAERNVGKQEQDVIYSKESEASGKIKRQENEVVNVNEVKYSRSTTLSNGECVEEVK